MRRRSPSASDPTAPPARAARPDAGDTRTRLLDTAAALLAAAGPAHVDQVTTRAVCEAAGVTAPTLYHHFGDKDGLVAAVVARTAADFLATKSAVPPSDDPVEDLRRGWDTWVAFALAHPALFALVVASPRAAPDALADAYARVESVLARVEAAGRLALPLPLALDAVWAAAQGVTALLVQRANTGRPLDDLPHVSATLRDAIVASVTRS